MTTDVQAFVTRLSLASNSDQAWATLRDLSQPEPGHFLFTVMTVDMEAGMARRVYSSHPVEYPVSGTKPITRDSWFEVVHGEKRSFVANSIEEIAEVFPDHDLIASLGCGSVLNLPVLVDGELVATINMLAEPGHYTAARVAEAERLLAAPARLCWRMAHLFDLQAEKPD